MPGTNRLVVVENKSSIYSFPDDPQADSTDLMLNLAEEIPDYWRTYGIAWHPDFESNRYVYLCYVLDKGNPTGTHVSRFTVTGTDPPQIDAKSERIVLHWPSGGHNGGCLQFGPDGYLYISTGDGQDPNPPDALNSGQNLEDLFACILRIDVDHESGGKPYAVPPDNPFLEVAGARPEIWAYGLRNPWKMSFDPRTGDLWVGDVGWEMWEMIYRIERGGNYGWSVMEGPQLVRPEAPRGHSPILPPVVEHAHTEARSITGGRVYAGREHRDLQGAYVYGDYVTGKLWALRYEEGQSTWLKELADSPLEVIAFGEDHRGELLVLDYGGTINRLVKNADSEQNREFPARLSETGLFASAREHDLAPGVLPYSINAEPWADHAVAQRFIGVPGDAKLEVYEAQNVQVGYIKGDWEFPADTVLGKTLLLEMIAGDERSRRRIETQILHRDGDTWRAYTFAWNDDQMDAELVDAAGVDRVFEVNDAAAPEGVRKQTWHFAARTECIVCHTTRAGSIHGFKPPQLDKQHDYGTLADQLTTLNHIGLFVDPPPDELAKQADPYDQSHPLADRAKSYLHINCAHCHRRGGGGNAPFELRQELTFDQMGIINVRPTQGTFAMSGAQVIAPGDPFRSVLYYRMAKLGPGRMPHAGSSEVDVKGLELMHRWINHLAADSTRAKAGRRDVEAQTTALDKLCDRSSTTTSKQAAVTELLESTSGALRLLWAIDQEKLSESEIEDVVLAAAKHPAAHVRDLFERFIPLEDRIQRLGSIVEPTSILRLSGDARRGESLFFKTEGVQCKSCHRINRQGSEVGPDLTQIGKKYDRSQLLETILEPSKKIEPKYVAYLIETAEGRILTGLIAERSAQRVVLIDAQGKRIEIPAADVELLVPQPKSIMPELLLRDMTAQQVADLIEYLASLK